MRCPHCETDLVRHEIKGVHIDQCPICNGIWLDKGELNALVDEKDRLVEYETVDHDSGIHGDPYPKRNCPRCLRQMKKVDLLDESSPIIYDYCAKCQGFWLDQGEIGATRQFLKRHQKHTGLWDWLTSIWISYDSITKS